MKMKEVMNGELKGKVVWEIKMDGVSVIRFVKKRVYVYFEVMNEWKRNEGIRILKENFVSEKEDGDSSLADQDLMPLFYPSVA